MKPLYTSAHSALMALLVATAALGIAAAPPPKKLALTNARIIPVVGETIPRNPIAGPE